MVGLDPRRNWQHPEGPGSSIEGEVRSQFCHVIDIAPTILEATKLPAPTMINGVPQKPIEGTSLVYTFDDANAATKHTTQYFEMQGNRAIYHDGWMASTTPQRMPWAPPSAASVDPNAFPWELYHVADDFSQANNLAAERNSLPKLKELLNIFAEEAKKYNVYPLDTRFAERRRVPSSEPHRGTHHIHLLSGRSGTGPHSRRCNPGREEQGLHHYCGHLDSQRRSQRCARHAGRTVRRLGIALHGR